MNLSVSVYYTTRKDSLPDLRSFKDEGGFYKWRNQVKDVAFKSEDFDSISDITLAGAGKNPVVECFVVIEYPPGKMLEADDQLGEKLRDFIQVKRHRFTWKLTRDEQAAPDDYKVSLEVVVDKKK